MKPAEFSAGLQFRDFVHVEARDDLHQPVRAHRAFGEGIEARVDGDDGDDQQRINPPFLSDDLCRLEDRPQSIRRDAVTLCDVGQCLFHDRGKRILRAFGFLAAFCFADRANNWHHGGTIRLGRNRIAGQKPGDTKHQHDTDNGQIVRNGTDKVGLATSRRLFEQNCC